MFCTHCGYNLEDNSVFCGNCGYKLDGSQGAGANVQSAPRGYNPGVQPYYGNNYSNIPVYRPVATVNPRPYSHSLTISLISIIFIFLTSYNTFFSLLGLGMSIAGLVVGALHLSKRSCAVGGFVVGLIFTIYYLITVFNYFF